MKLTRSVYSGSDYRSKEQLYIGPWSNNGPVRERGVGFQVSGFQFSGVRFRVSGFRRDGPARIKQFAIDRIALRRFSDDPSPLSFWQLSLECLLEAVQRTDTFLIPGTKRSINFGSDVTFLLCHEQVVYGFCSLTSAPIDSLDFVAYVTVVIVSASCAGELLEERRICDPVSYFSSFGH